MLEVLKGNIVERSCDLQRILVSGIEGPIPAPILAVVRSPSESRCRNAQSGVCLNCRFPFLMQVAGIPHMHNVGVKKPGLFAGHDPTRGSGYVVFKISRVGSGRVGSGSLQNLTGRVGSDQEFFKSRGSGQVGSRVFQISRVGPGRVKR